MGRLGRAITDVSIRETFEFESTMDELAIDISNLWFSYDGHSVLQGVDLQIARGEMVSVIGPNGGGKTTLLKLILGLLSPQRGSVRVFGCDPREVRPRIGYTP